MHILINISNNLGGSGLQVAISFLQECKKINEHTFSVAVLEKNSKLIDINSFPTNFSFHGCL